MGPLVENSSKPVVGFNFYKQFQLSSINGISSGGFLKKPSLEIILS
jgi:hypothetical protein